MTIRNLDFMLKPSSVALIGASHIPSSIGAVIVRNLFSAGFRGEIFPVNPKGETIDGIPAIPDIADLPKAPELAVIATPADSVPAVIAELGALGTKAAVVISAGFGEGGSEYGRQLCNDMLDAARPHLLRIVGPNCLGVMVPHLALNASMAHLQPLPGSIAFVAQSGAVQTAVLDWAVARHIGFSYFVSLGDMADVDFGDMLDYLASDLRTRAILLYMETITHPRKFMSAARTAARMKPVIVVKAGRSEEGAGAAARHTGALPGTDGVYEAVFQRAGILRVKDMQSLLDAVETLAMMPRAVTNDRLAILTNGGGVGVIATDALIEHGGRLAELSPETMARLDAVLPPIWSHGNPVDIISDAAGDRYSSALEILLEDEGTDAVLVLHCPLAFISSTDAARAIIDTLRKHTSTIKGKPPIVLTSWLGEQSVAEARRLFSQNRVPTYKTPADAVRAFMQMVRYRRSQGMLMETPPSIPGGFEPDTEQVQGIMAQALSEGRRWLTEIEAKNVLSAYAVPVVPTRAAATPEEAAAFASEFGGAVALKVLSPESVYGNVCDLDLDLETPEAVRETAAAVLENVRKSRPDASFPGFTVQPVVRRPYAHELMIGMIEDAQFGPVLLFGHGGAATEVVQDKVYSLPPLNMHLARDMMSRTLVHRLLKGYGCMPPANMDEIALTLVKVSQLVCDVAEIVEIDINPLLVDEQGVLVLDVRMRIAPSPVPAPQRLAIRPYPKELEEIFTLPDGRTLKIRPIRPEDEPEFQKIIASLSPEGRRLRFMHPIRELSHSQAALLTQIDYDREMALVLAGKEDSGKEELYGSVRIIAGIDNERAEYAIVVRPDMAGKGLGKMLMERIIHYARSRGLKEIFGSVLNENRAMLKVCRKLGFTSTFDLDNPGSVVVSLKL